MSRPLASLRGPEDAREGAGRNKAPTREAKPRVANKWHTQQQRGVPGRRAQHLQLSQSFGNLPNAGCGSWYRRVRVRP